MATKHLTELTDKELYRESLKICQLHLDEIQIVLSGLEKMQESPVTASSFLVNPMWGLITHITRITEELRIMPEGTNDHVRCTIAEMEKRIQIKTGKAV